MNQVTYSAHSLQWRPRSVAPARQMGMALRPRPQTVVTRRLGQASKVAQGADLVSGILTGGAAIVSGIALAVFVGGEEESATARPTWKWIGGITAVLGAVKVFNDISKGTAVTAGPDVVGR